MTAHLRTAVSTTSMLTDPTWFLARSAVRGHRSSLAGVFFIVLLAAALLTVTGAWIEAGVAASRAGVDEARFLTTIASSFAGTTVLIVVFVVASTFAAALRQRAREFALLRTLGATPGQLRHQAGAETLLVFAVAAPLGIVPGALTAGMSTPLLVRSGLIPEGLTVGVPVLSVLAVPTVLVPTALLAARLAMRQVSRADPAGALSGAGHESSELRRPRRIAAFCIATAGLLTAGTPFVLPGTVGSAAGASSALLLIIAAAIAGPMIVQHLTRAAARVAGRTRRPWLLLALANVRGFSRRVTTPIIPLALLLALGTVQAGLGAGLLAAAEEQLRDGVKANLVVTSGTGLTESQVQHLTAADGVSALTTTATFSAEAKIDQDDELEALEGLLWEPTEVRTLDGRGDDLLLDLQVRAGALAGLDERGTIAVSQDVLTASGNSLGGTVGLRLSGREEQLRIVAVHNHGLGLGDYLISRATAEDIGAVVGADAALIAVAPNAEAGVRAETAALGLQALDPAQFAAQSTATVAGSQQFSTALSLVLLVFVGLAALNTLAMVTAGRRGEFQLLRRVGATRAQILATASAEAGLISVMAIMIGTAAVIPALVGAGLGLLGDPTSALDPIVYGWLALVVAVVAFSAVVAVTWRISGRHPAAA